jgi:hypothetical protein
MDPVTTGMDASAFHCLVFLQLIVILFNNVSKISELLWSKDLSLFSEI